MNKTCLILIFVFAQLSFYGQEVFNKLVVDTVSHITSSVITLDTNYVFLSGTRNEFDNRSFALNYTDELGVRQEKEIYGDENIEYWEGLNNSFKKTDSTYILAGSMTASDSLGVFLYEFDEDLTPLLFSAVIYDTLWIKGFNIVKSEDGFYITGQKYDYDLEKYRLSLIKADNDGNFLWSKSFGDVYESGRQILSDFDNNLLMGGRTYSYPVTVTNEDWYLIKTDTAGNILWERNYGHSIYQDGAVEGLIETNDSSYLACGSYPVAKYGTGSGEILWDGCLRKISCDGDLLWTKYLRSYLLSHTGDIYFQNNIYSIVEKNENIYAVGWNYGYVSWKDRGYLTKLDKEGNLLWKREYYALDTNTYSQYLTVLQPTNDNGFILAGYGNEYSTHGYDPPQQSWLVKTDSMGLDGLSNVELPDLNIDLDLPESVCIGDTISVYAYISGKSAPYTIEISNGQFIDSIYYPPTFVPVEIGLTHVDLEWGGSTYFQQTITEATLTNHEWGQCIAKPVDFYTPLVAGTTELHITVVDAYGESKTITKEVNVVDCGVEIAKIEVCPVKLYPNPVKDKVYVDIPKEITPNNAEIFNSLGQLVKIVNVHKGLNIINVADFTSGNYILKISANNENFSLSFEKK